MAGLRFALGCCWAATVIQHEHGGTSAAAATAGSTTGQSTITYYSHGDPPFFTRRTLALLLIACVHVILIYALASGLGPPVITAVPPPVTGDFLPATPKPRPPPPPPDPSLRSWPVDAPPLPPQPQFPRYTATDGSVTDGPPSQPHEPPQPQGPLNRVIGGPGKGFPNTAEYYPAASRRLAETGIAGVRVCVDGAGRLTARPTIAESSGSVRLDEGARALAQAGSGHYRPTTEDGRPVDSCYVFRVRFELRD